MIAIHTAFGILRRIGVHPDLEERPADIHHDRRVARAHRFGERHRVAEPLRLPRRLVDLERRDVGESLGERIVIRPVEERGPRADRRDVHRVPALVQQLVQIADAGELVGREDPFVAGDPAAAVEARAAAEGRVRDRRLPLARQEVVAHLQRVHVRAERPDSTPR